MSARNSLQTALMRPGDFHLRRDDRQMFGNYVVLSAGGGTPGPLKNFRRSAMVVATPVYDVPKLWWLDLLFETLPQFTTPAAPFGLTPWVPAALAPNLIKVTVRQSLDRDKQVATDVENLNALTSGPSVQSALTRHLYAGLSITVTVEIINTVSLAPLGVQASLCEVTNDERDAYRDSTITSFVQSNLSQNFLVPNPRRRQLFVQNWGSAPLYVAFSFVAVAPGLGAKWTVALPNQGDVFECFRDAYQGYVSGVWTAADASGVAMVTEGY